VDFESKWYQQAAAIREKHKVSEFQTARCLLFLFVFCFVSCFLLFLFCFLCVFFVYFLGGLLIWFVFCLFSFIILIIFNFPMNEGLSTS